MICHHCGSPNRFNPCWYYDNMKPEDAANVRASGADRPCDCDLWYENMMIRERANGRVIFLCLVLVLVLVGSLIYASN